MNWIKVAAGLLFLAVSLGAFGSHALKDRLSDYHLDVYKTAVLYHFLHALGLFVIAWLATQTQDPRVHIAGWFLLAGIVLFSGSLYLLSMTQIKLFGPLTPVGGLCFLIGWAIVLFLK